MIEWRVKRTEVNRVKQRPPQSGHYRTILTDENAFCPSLSCSMQENSENMVLHLLQILQLNPDHPPDPLLADLEADEYLKDHEILEYATQHDHPVFVSIDGSLDNNGIATKTISIIAPDIQDEDYQETEWQDERGEEDLDQITIDREVKTMEEKLNKYNVPPLGEVPTQQEGYYQHYMPQESHQVL